MATAKQTAVAEAKDVRTELKELREKRARRLRELEQAEEAVQIQAEPPEEIKDLIATQDYFHRSVKRKLEAVIGELPEPSEQHSA